MREPEAGIFVMKFSHDEIHQVRAKYYVSQGALAKDEEIKKFWNDLADEWLDMDARRQHNSHSLASKP